MIDLNIRTLTDLSLRWLEPIKRHRGGILNVAFLAGFLPGPGMAIYNATKTYVLSFTEAMHEELKSDGVKVCALCPGPVETEFFEVAGIPDDYFPATFSRSAGRVADEGYNGFMGGHRVVVRHSQSHAVWPRVFPAGWSLRWPGRRRKRRAVDDPDDLRHPMAAEDARTTAPGKPLWPKPPTPT